MATPDKHIIDHGQDTVRLVYSLRTEGMKRGDVRSMHIKKEHLQDASGVQHIDLLNPKNIEVQLESTAGKLGVNLHHDENRVHRLSTATRAVLVDQETGIADAHHAISSSNGVSDIHTLKMEPTADQLPENTKILHKRINSTWSNMDTSNVSAGVHTSTLNDETRYLVPQTADDGTPNAMHQLLSQNGTNSKLFGGKYMNTRAKFTSINGKKAYVLPAADFNTLKGSLNESLSTKSPFQHGLNVSVKKLDDRPTSRHPTYAHIKINRTPLHSKEGYKAVESNRVTDAHVAALTGTVPEVKATTATIVAPGFEEVVGKSNALETRAKVVPFIDDGEKSVAEHISIFDEDRDTAHGAEENETI